MDVQLTDDLSHSPPSGSLAAENSLKSSWAYQWRIPVSTGALAASVVMALWFGPADWAGGSMRAVTLGTGWALLLAGVLIRLWATTCLGGRKARELIAVGPYSLCRNPLYVGTFLIAVSQICFYQSLWMTPGILLPMFIYAFGVVPAEEQRLRNRLGAAYDEYCRTTPRWFPNPLRFVSSRLLESTASRA